MHAKGNSAMKELHFVTHILREFYYSRIIYISIYMAPVKHQCRCTYPCQFLRIIKKLIINIFMVVYIIK